jgi:hypothetical protein
LQWDSPQLARFRFTYAHAAGVLGMLAELVVDHCGERLYACPVHEAFTIGMLCQRTS